MATESADCVAGKTAGEMAALEKRERERRRGQEIVHEAGRREGAPGFGAPASHAGGFKKMAANERSAGCSSPPLAVEAERSVSARGEGGEAGLLTHEEEGGGRSGRGWSAAAECI